MEVISNYNYRCGGGYKYLIFILILITKWVSLNINFADMDIHIIDAAIDIDFIEI
jgi:hypothetical protein